MEMENLALNPNAHDTYNFILIHQGGHIKIHSHSDIPVQVDGEPWIQPPGDVVVFNSALKVSIYNHFCTLHNIPWKKVYRTNVF